MNILTDYLAQYFDEISPLDFYRDIFSFDFQKKGMMEDGKYNGIIVEIFKDDFEKRIYRHTVTSDLDKIKEVVSRNNFCLMSPISYIGKTRESVNARLLYALAIDLDGVRVIDNDPIGLRTLFHQINKINRLPNPTYIVSSGTGLHLYYVFKKPLMLYPNVVEGLQKYKKRLTKMIWQGFISNLEDNVQYESLFQGFRVVGTITKLGERARAFLTGDKVDMDYMNSFVDDEFQAKDFVYKTKLNLKEAKEKYPDWYQSRIVEKKPRGSWTTKKELYYWWFNRIENEVKVGHRYYCIMTLAIYARKAGIDREQLEEDAFYLLQAYDDMQAPLDNPFTEKDIIDGLQAYDDSYLTFPINSISAITGISIKKNKRNYRKQIDHIKIMNFVRDEINKNTNWREGNGRPSKKNIVEDYKKNNPNKKKIDCHRETGLSRVTIDKYW